jgi:hypothetical protein
VAAASAINIGRYKHDGPIGGKLFRRARCS